MKKFAENGKKEIKSDISTLYKKNSETYYECRRQISLNYFQNKNDILTIKIVVGKSSFGK